MGVSKYHNLCKKSVQSFKGCCDRVRDGKSPEIEWPRSREGCIGFINEIGPVPKNMEKPSVGRIDHSKGYASGNIRWEEHKYNSVKRRGTKFENETSSSVKLKERKFTRGSPEYFEHQRKASLKRWSDPEQREQARKRFIENNPNRRRK